MKKQRDLGDVITEFRDRLTAITSPLRKFEQAAKLMAEGEAELAALFGSPKPKKSKKKPVIEISYKAPVMDVGDFGEDPDVATVSRVFKGAMKFDDVQKKAKLSAARTRVALHAMRDAGHASLQGKGRNSVWVKE